MPSMQFRVVVAPVNILAWSKEANPHAKLDKGTEATACKTISNWMEQSEVRWQLICLILLTLSSSLAVNGISAARTVIPPES
jgi:hypothetical protein